MAPRAIRPDRYVTRALLAGALLALATACNRPQASPPTSTDAPPAATAETPSPTPSTLRVVLVASAADSGAALTAQAETKLQALAEGSALELLRADVLPGDAAGIVLLIALPPDPGIQAWASAHPETQVVSLGVPGVQPMPNVTVIAPDGLRYDQLGFALGYLAAMVTPEYRLGALPLDSSPENLALARGFVAGGTYYCGLCLPVHPPYLDYPVLLQRGAAELTTGALATLLVAPIPQSLADLGLPANSSMSFVGIGTPAGDLASTWIASAEFDVDAALESAWAGLQDEISGTTIALGIRFHAVDPNAVSAGRLALAERLLADLSGGVIDTGVDPLTGELR